MLINSLFLFLREALPLFLLLAMLIVLIPAVDIRKKSLLIGLGGGIALYLLQWTFIDYVSQFWDGAGLEISFFISAFLQVVLFLFVLAFSNNFNQWSVALLLSAILMLLTMVSLLEFLTFFSAMWLQQALRQPLLTGIAVGAGISASLAVLLYFALYWLHRRVPLLVYFTLGVFVSGRLGQAVNLLAQVGFIDSDVIWSTQGWLSDQSAVAQILSGFVGYESTPIAWQVYSYVLCLLAMVVVIILRRKPLVRMTLQHRELL